MTERPLLLKNIEQQNAKPNLELVRRVAKKVQGLMESSHRWEPNLARFGALTHAGTRAPPAPRAQHHCTPACRIRLFWGALQKAGGRRWVGEARGAFQELNQIQREEQEELKPWEG